MKANYLIFKLIIKIQFYNGLMTLKSSIKNQVTKFKRIIVLLSIIFILPLGFLYPQPKTNLQIFYGLTDSAAAKVLRQIPSKEKNCKLNLVLGKEYSVLKNNILNTFLAKGKTILQNFNKAGDSVVVNFTIDNAKVTYGEMYRNGLFGDFFVPRKISLAGNFIILNPGSKMKNFMFTYSDSVDINKVKSLENISFPFTHGQLPAEPFFSSLFEPVIAIGATALAVILFFTIRSK